MSEGDEVVLFSHDEARRVSAAAIVQSAGFACRPAASLEEALTQVCSRPVGAVIVDGDVPHAECRVLRTECALLGIPLLSLGAASESHAPAGWRATS